MINDSWQFVDGNWTNSTNNDTQMYLYYSFHYRLIGTLFNSIIFVVGVLGNMMVVAVVTSTRSMHSPTNCYLVSLAVADMVALIATVPYEVLGYYLVMNEWLTGEIGCLSFVFSYNIGINASSLSLVAFTVERYVAICHPMKAHKMCTVTRAKKIILVVWIFTVIYCTPWLFLTELVSLDYTARPDVMVCHFKRPREDYVYIYLPDLCLFYVVPLAVSCYLYVCIARVLLTRGLSTSRGKLIGTIHVHLERRNGSSARNQVVKMLAVVVAVFATLWLPYRGLLVYNSIAGYLGLELYLDLWYLMFSKSCIYINCAINPILYNAMSFKFRRAFRRALSCHIKSERKKPMLNSINNSLKRKRSVNSTSTTTKITLC